MSDRDSEDEVDDDVADLEDRQVFHDFFMRSLIWYISVTW